MHLWFIQIFALFVFFGFSVYFYFLAYPILDRKPISSVIIGAGSGLLSLLFTLNRLRLEGSDLVLDAAIGPLLFAGYLGGPIAALIAASLGVFGQVVVGGPNTILGCIDVVLATGIGVVACRACPPRSKPKLLVLAFLASAYLAAQSLLILFTGLTMGAVFPFPWISESFLQVGFETASIAAIGAILTAAIHLANARREGTAQPTRFELATASAGMGVYVNEAGANSTYFDTGAMAVMGLQRKAGDVLVEDWVACLHPDDAQPTLEVFREIWADNSDLSEYEFRVVHPDGSIANIRSHWFAARAKDGTIEKLIGLLADITDLRETERKHSVAEARLARIADSLPGVLISFDMTGISEFQIVYVSAQCEKVWGYTAEEIIADSEILRRAHDPDDLPDMMAALNHAAQHLEGYTRRHKIMDRWGVTKWIENRVGTPRIKGNVIRMDGVFLDVTREVEAQERLEIQTIMVHRAQKNDSIGQLTGGVAHDFNNLLAIVLGNLELLRDELSDQDHLELIDNGIAAIYRGADLTRNMLAFARKAQLEPKTIDLNKLVRDTKNWAGRTLPTNIAIETSLLAGLWPVKADPSSTESALLNLILNARDAMADGGKLTLETANVRIDEEYLDSRKEILEPGRYVMLAVSDTGHGIPPEQINTVFEPFFSTKAPGSGSGLGLSMIEGFMHQSNGTVQVYSEPGFGTTFKLYFPIQNSSALDSTFSNPSSLPYKIGTGRRLLVAEDEPEVLRLLVANLQNAGFSVTQAHSGDQAKQIFDADPNFDLLLTDIVMSGKLQGTTLSHALRRIRPDLPVVFMSGYASEATVHGNGLRPEDVRLMKPVGRDALLAAIKKSLAQKDEDGI